MKKLSRIRRKFLSSHHPPESNQRMQGPSLLSDSIKQYYEEWWENPRDIRNPIFDRLNELVVGRIRLHKPGLALDLGSGKGRVLSMLLDNGSDVTAVEFNSNFVTELRAKFPDAKIICADVRNWQPDQRYDLVTCIELTQVLSHEELAQLLRQLRPFAAEVLISVSN